MRLDLWHDTAPAPPDAPALREATAVWDRAALARATRAGGAWLEAEAGIAEGTVCAVLARPTAAGVAAVASVLASRGALAALNPAATPAEIETALEQMRPAALVVEPGTRDLARAVWARSGRPDSGSGARSRPALVEFTAPDAPPRLLADRDPEFSPLQLPADRKIVVWTSGTTGHPRAITLRATGVLEAARAQIDRLDLRPGEALPASLPLSAVGGLMIPIRAALAGAVVETAAPFDPDAILRLAARQRVHHLSLVPVLLRRLLDALSGPGSQPGSGSGASLGALRTVLVGGAATPPDLIERARRMGLPLALTWGMTESAAQAATALAAEVDAHPETVGHPLDHLEVRVDPDGRLALRLGRLDPAEIDASGRVVSLCDAEGWFRSGDLGRLTPEGRVVIVGRAADRVISGGVNVDPAEVERMLLEHPGVDEALVVGVPDPEWGERVVAVIVPAQAASSADGSAAASFDPLQDALEGHVREHMSAAKRPRSWRFVSELPRTVAGKPDRRAAAALWAIPGPEVTG